jgi:hypothetical protein
VIEGGGYGEAERQAAHPGEHCSHTETPFFSSIVLSILQNNSRNSKNKSCSSTCTLQHCLKARHQKLDGFEDFEFRTEALPN